MDESAKSYSQQSLSQSYAYRGEDERQRVLIGFNDDGGDQLAYSITKLFSLRLKASHVLIDPNAKPS